MTKTLDEQLQDIDTMTDTIISDVRKAMSPPPPPEKEEKEEKDDKDEQDKQKNPALMERAIESMNKSLGAVLDLFKASKKMDGPDMATQEKLLYPDMDIPPEYEAEEDGAGAYIDRERMDATPILKAIDFNLAVQNRELSDTNRMLQALLKMQVAGLEINKAFTAQMAQNFAATDNIQGQWANKFPHQPQRTSRDSIDGMYINRANYPEFMRLTNAVNKAMQAGQIDVSTAAACHDQHIIRPDVWALIEPFADK